MLSLFVSHGSPMLALEESATGRFLDRLSGDVPHPAAIIVASAHYLATTPSIGAGVSPTTVHDFGGFSPALRQIRYPAPGAPQLAARVAERLWNAGFSSQLEPERGFDHGVWVPLHRMYPDADIPIVPISVNPRGDAAMHHALGSALAGLRSENILVLGSGGFVHNLGELDWSDVGASAPGWATEFADWMRSRLRDGDLAALLAWRSLAPHAQRAHPTHEHLMPLFVALGAAGPGARMEVLHRAEEFGTLSLDAYAFA